MAEESDIVELLKGLSGEAPVDEISRSLGIPSYGPNSAYILLRSLRSKGIVDRKGDRWTLLSREAAPPMPPAPLAPAVKEEESGAPHPAAPKAAPSPPTNVEQIIETMSKTLRNAMSGLREPSDEWELAKKPMETAIEDKKDVLGRNVLQPDLAPEAMKPLLGSPTGTFLDNLFFRSSGEALGGIPAGGQLAMTGLPGAGKSILVEEIGVRVSASGRKVLYVTAEDTWKSPTPRFDLQSRMKQKADVLGLNWEKIRQNLFVIDTVFYPDLRNWSTFAENYRFVVEKQGIELVIVDSVTVLEAYRGALKYRVMELARYNQLRGVTALFLNQRSAETWDSYDMAGGIGLAHNLDGTVIVDYGRVYWPDQQRELDLKRGEFVRIARVLDCRLCNFERERIQVDITPDGFIRPVESKRGD